MMSRLVNATINNVQNDQAVPDAVRGAVLRPGSGWCRPAARTGSAAHQAGQSILAVAAGGRGNGRHPRRAQARNAEAALARRLMERRPTKVATVALANSARMAWAIMVRGERYKEPKLLLAA